MTFDAIQFMKDFDIPFVEDHPKVSAGWAGFCCPYCHDHNYKAAFHVEVGYASCWVDGKLDTIDLISALTGSSKSEAKHIFSKYLNNRQRSRVSRTKTRGTASSVVLPSQEFTPRELRYLNTRKLSTRIEEYDIRSGGVIGKWAHRIVFPITLNGNIVSATGRAIHKDTELRYLTLAPHEEVVCHKSLLLNEDKVDGDHVVLVEGVVDSVRGNSGFVASFGLSLTPEQIIRLTKYRRVSIIPDAEDRAYRAWSNLGNILCGLGVNDVEMIKLSGVKDIGEMSDDEIRDLRRDLRLC